MTGRKWVEFACIWHETILSHLTNSEWVTCTLFCKAVSSHPFLWPTQVVSDTLHICERQSHGIFSYDQQRVSVVAPFVKGSLITSFPMTNSKWVTLHILWKAVSHLYLWPTGSEWHCTLCERHLITSFPMTNSLWVTLHILQKAVSSHLSFDQ